MKKADIRFKIVTPMILAGADQKKAEMRAPSIRGQLRFWFRVLGGTPEDERKIFGGIGKDEKGRASAVTVKVKTQPSTKSHQKMEDIYTAKKFDYLLWPLRKESDARGIILDGQNIDMQVMHRRIFDSSNLNENIIKTFLLLGSLGTRSRRAYGSIYPVSVKFDDNEWAYPKNINDFQQEISKIMHNVNCKILKLKSADSAKNAIQTCADALKRFRCGKSGHGFDASPWGGSDHDLMHKGGNTIYRAAIALPHQTKYYSTSIAGYERMASPVIFKIALLENQYVPIVLFLKDYFIPEGEKVKLTPTDRKRNGTPKDTVLSHDLLNEMMNENSSCWQSAKCLYEKK